jgi:hypothetical protein
MADKTNNLVEILILSAIIIINICHKTKFNNKIVLILSLILNNIYPIIVKCQQTNLFLFFTSLLYAISSLEMYILNIFVLLQIIKIKSDNVKT